MLGLKNSKYIASLVLVSEWKNKQTNQNQTQSTFIWAGGKKGKDKKTSQKSCRDGRKILGWYWKIHLHFIYETSEILDNTKMMITLISDFLNNFHTYKWTPTIVCGVHNLLFVFVVIVPELQLSRNKRI